MSLQDSDLNINRTFEYRLLTNRCQIGETIRPQKFPELSMQILDIEHRKYPHYDDIEHISMILLVNGYVIRVSDTDLEKDKVSTVKSNGFKYIFQGITPTIEGPNETHLIIHLTKVPEKVIETKTVITRELEPIMPSLFMPEPLDIREIISNSPRRYSMTSVVMPEETYMNDRFYPSQ